MKSVFFISKYIKERIMLLPSFQLTEKIALVTGAGRGIGRALAVGLAEAGADVVIISRTLSDLEQTAEEICAQGRKAWVFPADISSSEEVTRVMNEVYKEVPRIDILVNNAGMNVRTPALAVTDEEWEIIMNTNLRAAFKFCQAVGKHMTEQGSGKIINISSVGGEVALRTGIVYGATKAALLHMTRVLALEWGKYGVNVNAIGPWYFKTPLTERLLEDEAYVNEILDRTPLRRLGEMKDLIGATVFLASEASDYVTGQSLFVDGGMTIYGF
jgi:NAD(P)-dependent dehydrogenase (short-subunit alcohol dehydrogenase family)